MNIDNETILIVEDNEADLFIFRRIAQKAGIKNPIQIARTGEEAVEYLAGRGRYEDRTRYPQPLLVLLDLKLPLKDGLDVLHWLRTESETKSLKVVVLTSSSEPRDVQKAYELGALSYLIKPPIPSMLLEIVNSLRTGQATPESRLPIEGCLFLEAAKRGSF